MGARLSARAPVQHLRQHHVLDRREFRQQVVIPVDEAQDPAAQSRPLAVIRFAGGLAIDDDVALVRPLQQAGDMQQCRLAAARLADQGDDLAGPQIQGNAAQHFEAPVALHEGALDVAQGQREFRITHDAVLRPVRLCVLRQAG